MPSAMPGPGSDRSESEDVWSRSGRVHTRERSDRCPSFEFDVVRSAFEVHVREVRGGVDRAGASCTEVEASLISEQCSVETRCGLCRLWGRERLFSHLDFFCVAH